MPFLSPFDRKKSNQKMEAVIEEVDPETEINNIEHIEQRLLAALGVPPTLLRVDITKVGVQHYRANVICQKWMNEDLMPTNSIPHSYYATLVGDEVSFEPQVLHKYGEVLELSAHI